MGRLHLHNGRTVGEARDREFRPLLGVRLGQKEHRAARRAEPPVHHRRRLARRCHLPLIDSIAARDRKVEETHVDGSMVVVVEEVCFAYI